MTEEEWRTQCGFHLFESRPLYTRATARQVVLLVAAWLRRFDRYWAPLPSPSEIFQAIFHNRQMARALDFLERWADGEAGPLGLKEAARDAREAAHFARVLVEDLVEDTEERRLEYRAYVTDWAADSVEFACDLIRLCGDPRRNLAEALAVLGDRSNPNLPPIVLEREEQRRGPRFSTPQQRYLDRFVDDLRGPSQAVAEEAGSTSELQNAVHDAEFRAERPLMHDLFGNPFRPVVADPAWLSPATVAIAAAIYQDRAFDRMPVLADALEEAGCGNTDILLHCRTPGEHVRGCWVVDLVLGKE